jgi:hypothetical protein
MEAVFDLLPLQQLSTHEKVPKEIAPMPKKAAPGSIRIRIMFFVIQAKSH